VGLTTVPAGRCVSRAMGEGLGEAVRPAGAAAAAALLPLPLLLLLLPLLLAAAAAAAEEKEAVAGPAATAACWVAEGDSGVNGLLWPS
jgi:hypothetical protein